MQPSFSMASHAQHIDLIMCNMWNYRTTKINKWEMTGTRWVVAIRNESFFPHAWVGIDGVVAVIYQIILPQDTTRFYCGEICWRIWFSDFLTILRRWINLVERWAHTVVVIYQKNLTCEGQATPGITYKKKVFSHKQIKPPNPGPSWHWEA